MRDLSGMADEVWQLIKANVADEDHETLAQELVDIFSDYNLDIEESELYRYATGEAADEVGDEEDLDDWEDDEDMEDEDSDDDEDDEDR